MEVPPWNGQRHMSLGVKPGSGAPNITQSSQKHGGGYHWCAAKQKYCQYSNVSFCLPSVYNIFYQLERLYFRFRYTSTSLEIPRYIFFVATPMRITPAEIIRSCGDKLLKNPYRIGHRYKIFYLAASE